MVVWDGCADDQRAHLLSYVVKLRLAESVEASQSKLLDVALGRSTSEE